MVIESIRAECRRYKAAAEAALAQLGDSELAAASGSSNSAAAIVCHLAADVVAAITPRD
jgi:hypothetical protein